MRIPHSLKSISILSIAALSMLSSCKSGIAEDQKLFLDYAKLEDKYNGSSFYRNFDVYSAVVDAPEYTDASFNINSLKTELKKSFRLVGGGDGIEPEYNGAMIPYPHSYILTPQPGGSFHVQLSVFVPDEKFQFSLGHDDIGKKISKDGADITLLDMTSDGVTLMVENKNKRQSYDYTYDMVNQVDPNGKDEVEDTQLGYHNNLFKAERPSKPNTPIISIKDSVMSIEYDRLNISLTDEQGKTILSDGRINDFRHYLWYRNHDMPYPELADQYRLLRNAYIETDKDPKHKYNPIYIVNLRAMGKVDHVDLFLRGNKGHVEKIDLGNQVPQPREAAAEPIKVDYFPIQNLEEGTAAKLLKVNYSYLEDLKGTQEGLLLYASLPEPSNTKDLSMSFKDVFFMIGEKDSVMIPDSEMPNAREYFSLGVDAEPANLLNAKLKLPSQQITGIKGMVDIYQGHYHEKTYPVNQLPKGLVLSADGLSINVLKTDDEFANIAAIYAYSADDKKKPLTYSYVDHKNTVGEDDLMLKYAKKPATVIVRSKTLGSSFNQKVPFEIKIEKAK